MWIILIKYVRHDLHISYRLQDIRQNHWTMTYRWMWPTFILRSKVAILPRWKKTKCFAGDFIDNQWSLKFCVQTPGLLKNCNGKMQIVRFNLSTINSKEKSLAWIIFPEICSDKSWKLTEIFYFYQIDTGIKYSIIKSVVTLLLLLSIYASTIRRCLHLKKHFAIL